MSPSVSWRACLCRRTGAVVGIMLGAAVLQLVQDVIILARRPGVYLDKFIGIMIVVDVVINQIACRTY